MRTGPALCLLWILSAVWSPRVGGQPVIDSDRRFTHEDLVAMQRLGDVAPSPDGAQAVIQVQTYSYDRDGADGDLYLVARDGSEAMRALTAAPGLESAPAWHPDGRRIVYVGRDDEERTQLFLADVQGGDARQLTRVSTGAQRPQVSPDGRFVAFLSEVYPAAMSEAENAALLEATGNSPTSAHIYTGFPYRDYSSNWFDGRRAHLLVVAVEGGESVDLLAGSSLAREPGWSGVLDYDWHPDGTGLVFSASVDFDRQADRFDTKDLYYLRVQPADDGGLQRSAVPELLVDRPTNDRYPTFSPDGRYLAWTSIWCCWGSLATEPAEASTADRSMPPDDPRPDSLSSYRDNRLLLLDMETGEITVTMARWDRPPDAPAWSSDGRSLFFTAPDAGHVRLFRIALDDALAGAAPEVLAGPPGVWGDPHVGGAYVYAARQRATMPPELFVLDTRAAQPEPQRLTDLNTKRLWQIPMQEAEEVFWEHDGRTIQGWLVRPPDFDPQQVYPLFLFPHGGPFGMHADLFHYRWNAQLFAAHGYVVFMPNPTGSTGFGESFAADIQGAWGGRVFDEIMAGVDHLLATRPYLDEDRMVAASASYGGYLMNWLITQTDRFKAVFTHAGVWNFVSMTGASIIAHYMLMDASGRPPWEDFEAFNRYSPHYYAADIRTPTYVSHGGLDAGVPVNQGMELYWTLQRLGVESKFIYFPDEGHWILKPANSRIWYQELLDWMDRHLP